MRSGALAIAALVALVTLPRVAWGADDTAVCNEGYTQAQVLRRAGKLRGAKQALVSCSQETCSSAIRLDCFKWTEEIDRALSTVVFDVRLADGSEVTAVRVYAGEELLTSSLDGRQIPMDPGETVLRFVHGTQSVEKRAIIREGEKFRTIHIELPPPPPNASAPTTDNKRAATVQPPPDGERSGRPIPTLSWVLGGVGALGLATFGVFAAVGYANESELRDGCFATDSCARSDVDAIRTQYLVGDVALGVGVVSLAAAVVVWLVQPSAPSTQKSARTFMP